MPKQAYYAARAIAERRQAQAATDPRVATVHAELSARYEALSSSPDLDRPVTELLGPDRTVSDTAPLGQPAPESSTAWTPTD